ncbi:MAG: hypothetical protein PHV82_13220, partial [Victivallaceae bacterium]|nr:hypothetical protein [Victivallaceae bacterium]
MNTDSTDAGQILKTFLAFNLQFASINNCTIHASFGQEWNYRRVPATFNRLYLIDSGYAEVIFKGEKYELIPSYAYLFPCNSDISLYCPHKMVQWRTHFNFWIFGSLDVFNLIDFNSCRIKPDHKFKKCFQLLVEEFSRNNIGSFLQCIRYLSSLIEPFLMEADTRDL